MYGKVWGLSPGLGRQAYCWCSTLGDTRIGSMNLIGVLDLGTNCTPPLDQLPFASRWILALIT